jgi:hypothetical protein
MLHKSETFIHINGYLLNNQKKTKQENKNQGKQTTKHEYVITLR